uniref:fructose-bisphosphatase n=1 Tax=Oryza glumipatula TaxID=40148 RepID=A0A0D9ZZR7_9ORYZ
MDHAAEAQRTDLMTITRHVLNEQGRHPESRGDFTILLSHIVLGCKFVASAVNKAGLAKLIGLAGDTNVQASNPISDLLYSTLLFLHTNPCDGGWPPRVAVQGEEQKKLDVLSNEVFVKALVSSGRTIFGIYMIKDKDNVTLDDVLQPGTDMLAAGYCMYGSSCTIPNIGKIYSVNEGNAKNWDAPTAKFVEKCKFPQDGSPSKSLRYIGSMVADVHRTLLYGGIFLYPADQKSPNGKLRVLYEVFPMSFLMEQAGGQAFTGKQRALELVPRKIHDRSPIFLGSYDDVEDIKALYASESIIG